MVRSGYCAFQTGSCDVGVEDGPRHSDALIAYPSHPPVRAEALSNAAKQLASSEIFNIQVMDWKELDVGGRIIFCQICQAIRNTRCVIPDITDLNFNVLFEYGFAVGLGLPVWPLIEEQRQASRLYYRFGTLTTIGHTRFKNSKTILTTLRRRSIKPWDRKPQIEPPTSIDGEPSIDARSVLYLMSDIEDEASLRVAGAARESGVDLIEDDPAQVRFQPLRWYANSMRTVVGVVIHLGRMTGSNSHLHHAKCALVGGLAVATGRRVLLLGEGVETGPIDYHDLLQNYDSARQAGKLVADFLAPVADEVGLLLQEATSGRFARRTPMSDSSLFERINLGNSIAEDEVETLGVTLSKHHSTPRCSAPASPSWSGALGQGNRHCWRWRTTSYLLMLVTLSCSCCPNTMS